MHQELLFFFRFPSLRGRVRAHPARVFRFDGSQLTVQGVVAGVRDLRIVQHVVAVVVGANLFAKLLQAFPVAHRMRSQNIFTIRSAKATSADRNRAVGKGFPMPKGREGTLLGKLRASAPDNPGKSEKTTEINRG